jgi:UDP-N-acetylglucosamine--N-acetylmuramyl-(pentapeptide) pyrophosphoryl-undecaprenol N-acetylglucosamine transferase
MKNATAVVSRSGAMSISELAINRKPAILVPSPNVANNHQFKNAKPLADKGAVIMVEEKNFSSGALIDAAEKLLVDGELRKKLSENISKLAIEDANTAIYKYIKDLLKK